MHRHAAGDIGLVDHRARPRQPLDHQHLVLVQQRQLGVVPHQLVHVLHEGQRRPAKVEGRRTAVCQFPQPHAQSHLPIGIAGQQSVRHQVVDQPVGGGLRDVGAARERIDAQRGVLRIKGVEDPHEAVEHRVPAR